MPGPIFNYNSDANFHESYGRRPVTGGNLIGNNNQPLRSNIVDQLSNPDQFSSEAIDNTVQHPTELQIKESKSASQGRGNPNSYNTKPNYSISKPSKSYLTSNKLSTSFKKKHQMVSKSLGPTRSGGARRAEMLTNGYKSLRAQGLLRATRVPDDVADNLNDRSFDEQEGATQSQTNILTNQEGKPKVELIEENRDLQNSHRSNKKPLIPQGLGLKEKNYRPLKTDDKTLSSAKEAN